MQARLKVLHDKANVKQVKLLPVTLIGRSTECNLKIASSQVSRAHCRITLANDTVYVEDLGSANGTMVDGKMLPPHQPTSIAPGATLVVGPAEFQVDYVASTSLTMMLSRTSPPIASGMSSTELIVPVTQAVVPQAPPSPPSAAPPSKARPVAEPKVAKPVSRPVVAAPVMVPVVGKPVVAAAVVATAVPIAVATVPVAAAVEFPSAASVAVPTEMLFTGFTSHDEEAAASEAPLFDFGASSTNDAEPSADESPSSASTGEKKGGLKSLFSMFGRAAKSSPAPKPTSSAAVAPGVFLPTMEQSGDVVDVPEQGSLDLGFGFIESAVTDSSAQTLSFAPPASSEPGAETKDDEDNGFSQFLNQL